MALYNLDWKKFINLIPERIEHIDQTEIKDIPQLSSYRANKLAEALHPQRQTLRIDKIDNLKDDIKLFTLVPAGNTQQLAFFSAGQYLSVKFTIKGNTYSRPYSICSSPAKALKGYYQIAVKLDKDGVVSNYISRNWSVGTLITTSAPRGRLTYEPLRDARTIIAIAGGVGITPFRSLAEAIMDNDEDCSLTILYGTKKKEDALFMQDFIEFTKNSPKIKIINVYSEVEESNNRNRQHEEEKDDNVTAEKGLISAELIQKYAPNTHYSLFIAGPSKMYDYLKTELPKLGIKKKYIRFEEIEPRPDFDKLDDYKKPPRENVNLVVRTMNEVKIITANTNRSILANLEESGIVAPSSCRAGSCGLCRSRLIRGDVYIIDDETGRREADKKYGFIHPCSSFPLTDLEIEIPPVKGS